MLPAPAGSLASTATDMAKFMIAHLQDGEFNGKRILEAKTAEQMHTSATTMVPPLNRMLLGFYEQDYNGHRVISHGGDTQWMHSYLHLFLDDHVGLFMSFNSQGHEGAVGHLRQALFDQFVDRYFPGPWPVGSVPKDVAAAHARLVAGYYDDSRRPDRSFMSLIANSRASQSDVAPDGTIMMTLMTGANHVPVHYQEIAPFVWRNLTTGRRLAAKVVDGEVVRISMDELSPFMVFDPTPAWRSPAWLLPALGIALLAVVLTGALWPVAAISRRRHGVQLPITGRALKGHRVSRIAAAALATMTVAWLLLLTVAAKDLANLGPSLDPVLLSDVRAVRRYLRRWCGGDALVRVGRVDDCPAGSRPAMDRGPRSLIPRSAVFRVDLSPDVICNEVLTRPVARAAGLGESWAVVHDVRRHWRHVRRYGTQELSIPSRNGNVSWWAFAQTVVPFVLICVGAHMGAFAFRSFSAAALFDHQQRAQGQQLRIDCPALRQDSRAKRYQAEGSAIAGLAQESASA